MSIHDNFNRFNHFNLASLEKTSVEVILLAVTEKELLLKEDESKTPRRIPRVGIKIEGQIGKPVTLTMFERLAVKLNLV